jgi:D-alanyl-D-alanine dipeptidase
MTDKSMVLLCDPRVGAVAVAETGEPMVDVGEVDGLRVDTRAADPARAFAYLRHSVVQRLLDAQATLPDGLRLLVVEGYRPTGTQRSIFDGYRDELRRIHPRWTEDRLYVETSKFASPVELAPHATGGAVDLTLCTEAGEELDMGTPIDATPGASANACYTAARDIPERARDNRRTLVRALAGTGLVNYPTEWWHWSFGDRYWAYATGTGSARYGPVRLLLSAVGRDRA